MISIDYQPTTKSDVWPSAVTIPPSGLVLHSTAWPGRDAQYIRDNFNQPARGASIHAAVDNRTIIQCLPWAKRAGHVGSGSKGSYNNSHIGVEMCEPTGIKYNSAGSVITSYDPPAGYFGAVWRNAVELFAHLCGQYGLDPLGKNVIVSHAEAHALGYGSNHGDTGHWFPKEGKTMDDFRAAVAAAMSGESKEENFMADVNLDKFKELWAQLRAELRDNDNSAWSEEARAWAASSGLVIGGGTLPTGEANFMWEDLLTREQAVMLMYRFAQLMGKA